MCSKRIVDITGQRFKSLTATGNYIKEQQYKSNGKLGGSKLKWECVCDCGAVYWIYADSLKRRKSDYCVECKPEPIRNSRLYHLYYGIKQRCYNENDKGYKNYGGRGIIMSDEWAHSFNSFKEWALKTGYIEGMDMTIDRIDNDGNYCAENCQWLTRSENSSKGNLGKVKSHSHMTDMYAISPSGERIEISNIAKFARDNDLNLSSVGACLRGYKKNTYHGWTFHSNRSRP